MTLWLILAAMTLVAILLLLRPVLTGGATAAERADDRAFYEAQIAEIERDLGRGTISATDAEAARTEAARRLLRVTSGVSARPPTGARSRMIAAGVAVIAIPLVALPLYARFGGPTRPAMPRAERVALAEAAVKVETREGIREIFALLEKDPRNPILLDFLVPRLLQTERYEAAANALTIIVEEMGPTAKRLTDLAAARGAVARRAGNADPEVRQLLEKALELDPNYLLARFNLGLVKADDGDRDGALADLRALEAALPPDAPVRPTIARVIKQIVDGPARPAASPVPPGGDAIAALPADQRDQAIRGMVEGLDQRLAAQGGKPEEWLRLVRAYAVLKDSDKAKAAYRRARTALAGETAGLEALEKLARELGLAN